jgi:hypothetical protein
MVRFAIGGLPRAVLHGADNVPAMEEHLGALCAAECR